MLTVEFINYGKGYGWWIFYDDVIREFVFDYPIANPESDSLGSCARDLSKINIYSHLEKVCRIIRKQRLINTI